MKKALCLLFTGLLLVSFVDAKAQRQLTEEEKAQYKQRIEDVVNDFNGRVSEIWRRPNKVESQNMEKFRAAKEVQINAALKLFIGDGKPYVEEVIGERWNGYEYVESIEKVNHRAVIMETSSVNNSKITKQTIESYLRKAAKAVGSRIEVSACDAYFASDLKEVAPGRYEATVAFVQDFFRYDKEGNKVYADRTTKTIRVYLTSQKRAGEEVFIVELGDIRVVETVRI